MYGGYVVSPVSLLAQDALIEHTLAHSETRIVFAAPEFAARLSSIARIGSRVIVRPTSPDDLSLSAAGANAPCRAQRVVAGDADVYVRHDRHAEGRVAVARQSRPCGTGRQRGARARAFRPRAELAASLPRQRPVHRHDLAARVRRQHRDAAPLQPVAVVAVGRALSADLAQRRADDRRLPPQRPGSRPRRRTARYASRARRPRRCRRNIIAPSKRDSGSRCSKDGLTRCAWSRSRTRSIGGAQIGSRDYPRPQARVVVPGGAEVPTGERGEIGYAGQRDAALPQGSGGDGAHPLRRSWLATSDLGYRDADGSTSSPLPQGSHHQGSENIAPRGSADLARIRGAGSAAIGIRSRIRAGILVCVVLKPGSAPRPSFAPIVCTL